MWESHDEVTDSSMYTDMLCHPFCSVHVFNRVHEIVMLKLS